MSLTKVLLVEDEPTWLRLFQLIVGKSTQKIFDYVHVPTLAEAVAAAQTNQFGLILLDLLLPDSQPLNTLQTMTKAATAPVVVITTLDDEKLMQEAFVLGVDDYLVKDQYDASTFIHVSRQAIKRFTGRMIHNIDKNVQGILEALKSTDATLEEWQLDNQIADDPVI